MSIPELSALGNNVLADIVTLLVGDKISEGSARSVYQCRLRPDLVVKVENRAGSFQNIEEFNTWEMVRETGQAKWFAPVEYISTCGIAMLMRKTESGPMFAYPEQMPTFFTDLKYENFGWLDGRLVCHDYGFNLMRNTGLTKRMRKANWWSINQ